MFVFSCFVLFSARCGLGENDRRMSGLRARLFSLRPCHGKHTRALWDLVIPWYSSHTHACTHSVSAPCPPTQTHTHTPCYEMEGSGVKGQALQ